MGASSRLRPLLVAALAVLLAGTFAGQALAANNVVAKKCLRCHSEFKDMENVVAGDTHSRSMKAKSVSVQVGDKVEIIKFTDQTKVANVPEVKALKKPLPVLIEYEVKGSDKVATSITAKPIIKVPEKELMDVAGVAEMIKKSPAEGKYLLIDSRPPVAYKSGHIPQSMNIPFPKMPDMQAKLPQDKDTLLVFYCGGFR